MKLHYEEETGIYYAESTYAEKHIPKEAGFYWNTIKEKHWATRDVDVAVKLVQYAEEPLKLVIAKFFNNKVKSRLESQATDASINIPAPPGCEYLPFQKAGVAYAMARKNVLFGDDMGLGKTIQAIGVLNVTGIKRVLVICPATLKINWYRELTKWLVDSEITVQIENGTRVVLGLIQSDIRIINYDILKKHAKFEEAVDGRGFSNPTNQRKKKLSIQWDDIMSKEWDAIIVDEAHFIKNPNAKRSKLVYDLCRTRAKRIMLITGTPIMNRPLELHPLLALVGAPVATNFFKYAQRYCNAQKERYGWNFTGASNLEELQAKLRESVMVRRLKADVLKELPAKRRMLIELPASTPELKALVEKQTQLATETKTRRESFRVEKEKALATGDEVEYNRIVKELTEYTQASFEEMSRIRHETAMAKLPQAIEHLEGLLEETDKIVVFAHHRDVIAGLKQAFPEINVTLQGGDSTTKRQAAIDRFQNDPNVRMFIGSIYAAGFGISLTASSLVVFIESDWVPASLTQAEDRLHRLGQLNSVLIQHLIVDGSVDVNMAQMCLEKQEIMDKALNPHAELKPYYEELTVEEINKRPVEPEPTPRPKAPQKPSIFDDEKRTAVHTALKLLAGQCDGAVTIDGTGFNKLDAPVGKSLAAWKNLTDHQVDLALRILRKYHGQLPAELFACLYAVKEVGS